MKKLYKILLTLAAIDFGGFLITIVIYSLVTGCKYLPNGLAMWGLFGVLLPTILVGLITMIVGLKYLWTKVP